MQCMVCSHRYVVTVLVIIINNYYNTYSVRIVLVMIKLVHIIYDSYSMIIITRYICKLYRYKYYYTFIALSWAFLNISWWD